MSDTINYCENDTLVIVKCWCGLRHAVPQSLRQEQLRAHERGESRDLFCPLGHSYVIKGPSKSEQLQRRLEQQEAQTQRWRDEAETSERRRRATKGVLTRTKNRIGRGVCPCCNRHFKNLHQHMINQHPEYVVDDPRKDD